MKNARQWAEQALSIRATGGNFRMSETLQREFLLNAIAGVVAAASKEAKDELLGLVCKYYAEHSERAIKQGDRCRCPLCEQVEKIAGVCKGGVDDCKVHPDPPVQG